MKQIKEILIASVSLFLLGFGICMAVSTFFMYREGEQEYETLREYVKEEERKENESEVQAPTPANKTTVDFQALKKINSDIIAWIRIPDTNNRLSGGTRKRQCLLFKAHVSKDGACSRKHFSGYG